MSDGHRKSLVDSLKTEWNLLWESLAGEEGESSKNSFETGQLRTLSLEDVRRLTRELSQGRRKLNRRLESLAKEIELNTAKLESLRIIGGEDDTTARRINELTEQGQKISQELSILDQKLKTAREREDQIRRRPTPA